LCREPGIQTEVSPAADGAFEVTLTTRRPALWVWLELAAIDARSTDNFFHPRPRAPLKVRMVPAKEVSE